MSVTLNILHRRHEVKSLLITFITRTAAFPPERARFAHNTVNSN